LAAATEQAGDLISIMTPAGEVEYANTAFCRALGLDQKEIGHMMATDLFAPESRAQFDAIRLEVPAGPWRGTLIRQRKDESTFLSDCCVVALTDGAGQLTDFVAVERDSTHETELRDQLIHSERLAAVGQLVSGVAHELNNPLQSIIGFTELLLAAERRQETRSDLDQIHASARRAAKIVHNLLGFVRRSSAERAPADLNEIVQSTVMLRRYELATTGVELKENYESRLPPVLVSREEIQQIILNIVLNAEQAMKAAGLQGCLSVRTFCPQPSEVAIEIQDAGPGVPPALARRIFEPFFSTKGVGEGTGLGLSLALGIAEAHGGTLALIPVSSGACFRLTLPAAPSAAPVESEAPQPAPETAANGKRALVVDDEPALRQLLERLLVRRGFSVDVAEDGGAATELVQKRHYDVIFSDVQMPKMSGPAFLDWTRTNHPRSAAAFVFVMGGLMTPELQSAIDRDGIPTLSKPFGAASLDALLADLFGEPINA
jgi:two-component system NtrC family sensor kinase